METIKEENETSGELMIEETPAKVEQTEPVNMVMGEGLPNTEEGKQRPQDIKGEPEKGKRSDQDEELAKEIPWETWS